MGDHNTADRIALFKQGKAMPGKNGGPPRFPIADGSDLDSAIGLAKTDAERKHVYDQARKMNQLGRIPANWKPDGTLRS